MNKLIASAVLASVLSAWAFGAEASKSQVVIVNQSDWDIHELYLSSVDEEDWGPDQLREDIIPSGGRFTLRGIPCDAYDVQLIDEDGDACVVGEVGLCGDRDTWVISNDDLLACQAVTE
ncbi:hypothetical protein [Pseudomarimonas salicorniae]|uniref:Uncharacterized protein n=1 Tax=Pseudomarimonas salicorniae TaxID=2933270 RepID=A0ABT0GHS9_9GAMM|nr:hypothetical protein [Lysobacter sp. CAU 1642]MCK7593592.1 hypothetical protein [Lysobacter sp. CAU 1642]